MYQGSVIKKQKGKWVTETLIYMTKDPKNEKPVKEDSIIELLKNPEIEFEIYYKPEIEIHNPVLEDDVYYDPPEYNENI